MIRSEATQRTTVLTFARYYLPGYRGGGPIRTLASMVDRLSDEFDFHIVTLGRDAGDTKPYTGVDLEQWTTVGKAKVFYCGTRAASSVVQVVRRTPHDVLYLNSFFDPLFTTLPLLVQRTGLTRTPRVVLAPRGEFSHGALLLKNLKKRAFLTAAKHFGLHRGITWQASSDMEASDISRMMEVAGATGRIALARNLASHSSAADVSRATIVRAVDEPLRICFLSRISPMKNLDFALRVLANIPVAVRFDVYGPLEDMTYWQECVRIIETLPPHVTVQHHGSVQHDRVIEVLAQHDLFFCPSRGENFGHAIHESLRAGTPVLLSDRTPWRDVDCERVGWALPLGDPAAFASAIIEASKWDPATRRELAARAIAYATRVGTDRDAESANRSLFRPSA
jgi:glycosyltransferase involved in cell wall biosynthesis